MIVGGVRDERRHMDEVSHLKAERAPENTKGGVGQYIVACEAKATQVIRARDRMGTLYRREESSICHL